MNCFYIHNGLAAKLVPPGGIKMPKRATDNSPHSIMSGAFFRRHLHPFEISLGTRATNFVAISDRFLEIQYITDLVSKMYLIDFTEYPYIQ
jgi:hypothetical protein